MWHAYFFYLDMAFVSRRLSIGVQKVVVVGLLQSTVWHSTGDNEENHQIHTREVCELREFRTGNLQNTNGRIIA